MPPRIKYRCLSFLDLAPGAPEAPLEVPRTIRGLFRGLPEAPGTQRGILNVLSKRSSWQQKVANTVVEAPASPAAPQAQPA